MTRHLLFLAIVVMGGCAGRGVSAPTSPVVAGVAHRTEGVKAPRGGRQGPAAVHEVVPVPGPSVVDMCEPLGERRPYPTRSQRHELRGQVRRTCRAMGVSPESCKFFELVAVRESSYRPWARHKLAGDRSAALRGYVRNGRRYGWRVTWDRGDRKRGDTGAIRYEPVKGRAQNPYFQDVDRWGYGLGLGGLNVSNQLWRIDAMAPPEILCDPVLNVIVQVSVARAAVRDYHARNWVEVQSVYGGRTYRDPNGRRRPRSHARMDAAIRRRCARKGLDCHGAPELGTRVDLRRMTPGEVYQAAEEIRGMPLLPFDP